MNEVLTRAEIEQQFQEEWILLADPEVDENFDVVQGRVVWHSKDRDEVYEKGNELRLKASATLYTGDFPEDMAFVL